MVTFATLPYDIKYLVFTHYVQHIVDSACMLPFNPTKHWSPRAVVNLAMAKNRVENLLNALPEFQLTILSILTAACKPKIERYPIFMVAMAKKYDGDTGLERTTAWREAELAEKMMIIHEYNMLMEIRNLVVVDEKKVDCSLSPPSCSLEGSAVSSSSNLDS